MRTFALRMSAFALTALAPGVALAVTKKVVNTTTSVVPSSPIPEPTAVLLFGVGAAIVAAAVRRQRAQ